MNTILDPMTIFEDGMIFAGFEFPDNVTPHQQALAKSLACRLQTIYVHFLQKNSTNDMMSVGNWWDEMQKEDLQQLKREKKLFNETVTEISKDFGSSLLFVKFKA